MADLQDTLPFTKCYDARSRLNLCFRSASTQSLKLYDHTDIYQEAYNIVKSWNIEPQDTIFFLGIGLGYYPLLLLKIIDKAPTIVIVEPSIQMLSMAFAMTDLKDLLHYPKLFIHAGQGLDVSRIINEQMFSLFLGKQRVVTIPAYRDIFGDSFLSIEKDLVESIGLAKDRWKTSMDLGERMFSNTLDNLPSLFLGNWIGRMRGCLKGTTAVCVAAGPSLDSALPTLKKMAANFLIVAMDSAVGPLISNGIRPQIVVTCDSRKINFEKLRPFLSELTETILVFALEANADNVKMYPSLKRIAISEDNPIINEWLGPSMGVQTQLPVMATVSHAAVFTMMELGADPVVLVGMDMAFPAKHSHSSSAIHHYNIDPNKMVEVEGTNGQNVLTYRPLIDYRRQLEAVISDSSTRVINTCLEGAFIRGTEIRSIDEVAQTKSFSCDTLNDVVGKISFNQPMREEAIVCTFRWIRKEIDAFIENSRAMLELLSSYKQMLYGSPEEALKDKTSKEIFSRYDSYLDTNKHLMKLFNVLRLKSIVETEKRLLYCESKIEHKKSIEYIGIRVQCEMDTISSILDASKGFYERIVSFEQKYQRIHELKAESNGSSRPCDVIAISTIYQSMEEYILSIHAISNTMEPSKHDSEIYVDTIKLYLKKNILKYANELNKLALYHFPNDPRFIDLHKKIIGKARSIIQQAEKLCEEEKNIPAIRKIEEYLGIVPDDMQAVLLKRDLSNKISNDSEETKEHRPSFGDNRLFKRLIEKVEKYIASMKFERAVGVLEFLDVHSNRQSGRFREMISQIRMMQGDYESQQWHLYRSSVASTALNDNNSYPGGNA